MKLAATFVTNVAAENPKLAVSMDIKGRLHAVHQPQPHNHDETSRVHQILPLPFRALGSAFSLFSGTEVEVVFTPTSAGTRPGSLTVTSSDPSSPITVSLTGTALAPGAFTLTANGGSTASTTVTSGWPAGYNLSLTPQNGYTGAIILNCTPINPGQYASCSLLPSSITLNGNAAQASVATLNTVTSVATSQNRESQAGEAQSPSAFCLWD